MRNTDISVGLIKRGKYGRRAEKILENAGFNVISYELPESLPELIDDPDSVDIPGEILRADIILSYALHPDINLMLVEKVEKGTIVIPGGSKSGSRAQLMSIAREKGIKLIMEEVCCSTPKIKDEKLQAFFENFGHPEFEVSIRDGRIESVEVKRETLCGSALFIAEKLKNVNAEEAGRKAGYLAQIHPCWASRGIKGNIHLAGEIHKSAIEKAIKKSKER